MQEEARTLGFSAVLVRESESTNRPEGLPADSLTYRSTFFKGETGMAGAVNLSVLHLSKAEM